MPLKNRLFRIAFRLLSNREEAEDAVQEVYIKLWQSREKLSEYKTITGFAITVTKNYCIDLLRKKKATFSEIYDDALEGSTPTPEKQVLNKELYGQIEYLISKLPESQKLAIQLRDIEGMEMKEIADIMKIKVGHLRVLLSRARAEVRNKMIKQFKVEA